MADAIKEFDAGPGRLTPNDQAQQAAVQAGRRIGSFYHQIGEDVQGTVSEYAKVADDHMTLEDDAKSLAQTSGAYVAMQNAIDQQMKTGDPNDKMAIPRILDQWQQITGQFGDGMRTERSRARMQERVDSYGQRLMETARADQSTQALVATTRNLDTTVGNAQTLVSGPTGFTHLDEANQMVSDTFDHIRTGVEGSGMNADDEARLALKQDEFHARIGVQAVTSAIMQGQDGINIARQKLADQGWVNKYLPGANSGELVSELGKFADTQERALQDKQRTAEADTYRKAEQDARTEIGAIRVSLMPDADGNPPPDAVRQQAIQRLVQLQANNPQGAGAVAGEIGSLQEMFRTQSEDTLSGRFTQNDPATIASLNQRLGVAPGQPGSLAKTDLDDLRIRHLINDKTWEDYTRRIDDAANMPGMRENEERLTQFMRQTIGVKLLHGADPATLDPNNLFASKVDPNGAAALGTAINQTYDQFEALVHNGHSPAEAYDMLTKEDSPNSVWHVLPYWQQGAAQGPSFFARFPTTFGQAPRGSPNFQAPPTGNPGLDAKMGRIQANPMRPGEDWQAYKARVGI